MNLQAKLENIRKQKEQAIANYNALCGAEQMLLELLRECDDNGADETDND